MMRKYSHGDLVLALEYRQKLYDRIADPLDPEKELSMTELDLVHRLTQIEKAYDKQQEDELTQEIIDFVSRFD